MSGNDQNDSSDGGEKLTRYLDGLDGSCVRKKRVQNGSSFGVSGWKGNVVINCYGED